MPPANQTEQPAPDSSEHHTPKTKKYNVKLLKRDLNFSLRQFIVFILIFGGIGGYLILSSFAATPPTTNNTASATAAPDRLLIRFKANATKSQRDKILSSNNLDVQKEIPQIGVKVVHVPAQSRDAVAAALSHNPSIDFVEQDHVLKPQEQMPNDPYFLNSSAWSLSGGAWGWYATHTTQAWDITHGDPSTLIAILDTGIQTTGLSDFNGQISSTWNVLNNSANASSNVDAHGTYVAGVAGLAINNGVGNAGYCPMCKLMIVQVGTGAGAYDSDIANGLAYAADHGAKVANLSFGGTTDSPTLQNGINYAHSKGMVISAAAGNTSCDCKNYPAADQNVLGVAGVSQTGVDLEYDSNYGTWVQVAAPEGNITAWPIVNGQPGYAAVGGTSLASPVVAGIAGLLFSKNPALTNTQVEQALENTSAPVNFSVAHGRVDALAALQSLGFADPQPNSAPVMAQAPQIYYEVNGTTSIAPLTAAPQVGQVLVRAVGGWTGSAGLTVASLRWWRCDPAGANCTALTNGNTYTVQSADAGSTIKLAFTVKNSVGSTPAQALTQIIGGSTTPPPTVALSATPASITAGQSSTLTWSSTNATSCTSNLSGSVATSGSLTVSPTANTTYSLTCTGTGGSATASATILVAPAATPPATPTGLAPTPGNGSVILTWDPNTGANFAGYNLQWKPTAGSTWTSVSGISNITYTVSGLANGTSYDFQLEAVNTSGQTSAWTATVSAVPVAPPTDTQAPTVTITSPTNSSSIGNAKKVPISATATDNNVVIKVELYIDGQLKTTVTSPSLSYTWSINRSVKSGSHTIVVKAYDPAGNVGQASVTVTK